MSTLGNIVWLVLGGFLAALGYFIGGVLLCITIIGIPFGIPCFRLAGAVLTPFGKSVIPTPRGGGCLSTVLNLLWIIVVGWELVLVHLFFGILFAITIIGIPFAQQHFKLVTVALLPFSYKLE
jgi:uncharacterized membrane protein YccF (DUF307 family)